MEITKKKDKKTACIRFDKNSYAERIIKEIGISGETPYRQIDNVINADVERRSMVRVLKQLSEQKYISIKGKGKLKTIRLLSSGIEKLQELSPALKDNYMLATDGNNYYSSADITSVTRRVKSAEIMNVLRKVKTINFIPKYKPGLQLEKRDVRIPLRGKSYYYNSREIKNVDAEALKKASFSRAIGVIVSEGGSYPVYNVKGIMQWHRQGEIKIRIIMEDIIRNNFQMSSGFNIISAVMFGISYDAVYDILNNRRIHINNEQGYDLISFDNTFQNIHYLVMDSIGYRQLKMLCIPDWKNILNAYFFTMDEVMNKSSNIECDATRGNDVYISFVEGNIPRLRKFVSASEIYRKRTYHIYALRNQVEFLEKYTEDTENINIIPVNENDVFKIFNL